MCCNGNQWIRIKVSGVARAHGNQISRIVAARGTTIGSVVVTASMAAVEDSAPSGTKRVGNHECIAYAYTTIPV